MTSWKAPSRSTVSTFVVVRNALAVVDFAREVFDAALVRAPLLHADGSLWNVELDIGGCTIMIGEANLDHGSRPAFIYVHVPDCDMTFDKAICAGAKALEPPADRFYGDRDGGVEDPSGNWWWIATHKEDLNAKDIEMRARKIEASKR